MTRSWGGTRNAGGWEAGPGSKKPGVERGREELVGGANRVVAGSSLGGRQVNPSSSTLLYPTEGFRGWEVEHGGNGWAVEKNLTLVPGAPSQTCFVTSFQ